MTLNHESMGEFLFSPYILGFSKFSVLSMATFVIRKKKSC